MADFYVQASVGFTCCAFEATLLEEAFLAAQDWDHEGVTFNPSAKLAALFPAIRPGEPWSGLQEIFSDPDFPTFGAKIQVEEIADTPRLRSVAIYSLENFEPGAIAELIRICCRASLLTRPIGFEYAWSCSKPRVGEFGGGWYVIRADGLESGSTTTALAAALGPDG